jgi:hypothetical protein
MTAVLGMGTVLKWLGLFWLATVVQVIAMLFVHGATSRPYTEPERNRVRWCPCGNDLLGLCPVCESRVEPLGADQ